MDVNKKFSVDVFLQNVSGIESLPTTADFQRWCKAAIQVPTLSKAFHNKLSVLIRIVDSEESASLNTMYREKDGPTNVLSFVNEATQFKFDSAEQDEALNKELREHNSHLGDLVICESLLKEEATEQSKLIFAHWAHLVVHGVLHLQGYDHIDDTEAQQMEDLEINILEQLGFENPYLKQST